MRITILLTFILPALATENVERVITGILSQPSSGGNLKSHMDIASRQTQSHTPKTTLPLLIVRSSQTVAANTKTPANDTSIGTMETTKVTPMSPVDPANLSSVLPLAHSLKSSNSTSSDATQTAVSKRRITLAEAHARVRKAKAILINLQKQPLDAWTLRKTKKQAEKDFDRKKQALGELYANKTEQLNIEENGFEVSDSSIVVTVKGIVRHNIQFGRMNCAHYTDKRAALVKWHEDELRKLINEGVREIYFHTINEGVVAQKVLEHERELLKAVQEGRSDAVIAKLADRQGYIDWLWKTYQADAIDRAEMEFRKGCTSTDLNLNWANDILRPKEVAAAIETIEELVQAECPSMKFYDGQYYSIVW